MSIEIEHRPEAGAQPWFLVTRRHGREVTEGGYATREEAEANRTEFARALRSAWA